MVDEERTCSISPVCRSPSQVSENLLLSSVSQHGYVNSFGATKSLEMRVGLVTWSGWGLALMPKQQARNVHCSRSEFFLPMLWSFAPSSRHFEKMMKPDKLLQFVEWRMASEVAKISRANYQHYTKSSLLVGETKCKNPSVMFIPCPARVECVACLVICCPTACILWGTLLCLCSRVVYFVSSISIMSTSSGPPDTQFAELPHTLRALLQQAGVTQRMFPTKV